MKNLKNFFNESTFFSQIGSFVLEKIQYLGSLARLLSQVFKQSVKGNIFNISFREQCYSLGVTSLPIAAITLFFVGVVFAFQFGITLRTLGAVQFIGRVTSVSLLRELGAVFTALVVGGRIGAGMAAEIGSMKVTEQIDAIWALGANPIRELIIPRILATTLIFPLLTAIATLIGLFGALFVSWAEFNVTPISFYGSSLATVKFLDLFSGLTKSLFFGFGIALVGCHEGLNCGTGAKEVGISTTRAVVNVSLVIVFTDFFLTRFFALFY